MLPITPWFILRCKTQLLKQELSPLFSAGSWQASCDDTQLNCIFQAGKLQSKKPLWASKFNTWGKEKLDLYNQSPPAHIAKPMKRHSPNATTALGLLSLTKPQHVLAVSLILVWVLWWLKFKVVLEQTDGWAGGKSLPCFHPHSSLHLLQAVRLWSPQQWPKNDSWKAGGLPSVLTFIYNPPAHPRHSSLQRETP